MRTYTHKMIFNSKSTTTTIKVHHSDSAEKLKKEFPDLFRLADIITIQEYPLKDNNIKYLKGGSHESNSQRK